MNTTKCNSCGHEIEFREYPFCPHGYATGREPQQFKPIVVHQMVMGDGQIKYSYPGSPDDAVPEGYSKLELSTLAQADRFVKDRGAEEQELRTMTIKGEEEYWNVRADERHALAREQLQERLGKSSSKIGELVWAANQRKRDAKYRELIGRQVNFHIQALSYDKTNRSEYIDDSKKKISIVVNGSKR